MEKYNVVIIGCGNIAGGYDEELSDSGWPLTHAGAFSRNPAFNLLACCDPDASKLNDFQAKWGVTHGFTDIDDIDDNIGTLDIVSLCSPTPLHAKHLKVIFDWKPKLVFCEKPITDSLELSEYWVQRFASAGVQFVVNHNRRWCPDVINFKRELLAGEWGRVHSVVGLYNKGILNNGSHLIDLLHFLFGNVRLLGVGNAIFDYWENDPSVAALLETDNGIPIALNIGDASSFSLFEIQFVTQNGVVVMHSGGMNWSVKKVIPSDNFPGYKVLGSQQNRLGAYQETMARSVESIYNALTSNKEPNSTGITAVKAQRVCHQIVVAANQQSSKSR